MDYVKSTGCYQPLTPDHSSVSSLAEDVAFADITKVSSEEFAKQITLIELSFFKAIHREEFASLKWNGKEKHLYAPNIVASTRWFNQVNFWVQKEILKYSCVSKRTEMLSFFIKISKKLVEFNNLYSAMSIISALQVECIYRLRHTWAGLGNKDRAAYRRLEELFSQDDNCRRQREHMNSISLPGIPYLGLYLSDLTYTNVAQPRINGKPTAIWYTKINSIIDTIAYFQQSEYSFTVDETLNAYLCAQRYIEELQKFLEEDNYKTSVILEPPPTLPTPSLSYLPQTIYGANSSIICNSNNNNNSSNDNFDNSNTNLKNQMNSSTTENWNNNNNSNNSGFIFRSPSKLTNFVQNTKSCHHHHHQQHPPHYQNHHRHGSNVSCKVATVNSSFEADILPDPLIKKKSIVTHSIDQLNNSSVQVSNLNLNKNDPFKPMHKVVSWEQPEDVMHTNNNDISQSDLQLKEFSTMPKLTTENSLDVTKSTSKCQSNSQELEFVFSTCMQSSQLPPIPPRPFIDFEQAKHSTLSRLELNSTQLTTCNNNSNVATTDQCLPATSSSSSSKPTNQSSANYCKSFSVIESLPSSSLPTSHVTQSNLPSTKSVSNLASEFNLCSMHDVFDSSAVAVAVGATSLTRDDIHSYTAPSLSAETINPADGKFDNRQSSLSDRSFEHHFSMLATSTPPESPNVKQNATSMEVHASDNSHMFTCCSSIVPNNFNVRIICQGVVQRRTVYRFTPTLNSYQSFDTISPTSPLFASSSLHASNSSLSGSSVVVGTTGSTMTTNTKQTLHNASTSSLSSTYRPAGFSKWRRLWATLVMVGDGLTAYMIYFEPKVKNAIYRSQFQAHQCQIHCLFSPPPPPSPSVVLCASSRRKNKLNELEKLQNPITDDSVEVDIAEVSELLHESNSNKSDICTTSTTTNNNNIHQKIASDPPNSKITFMSAKVEPGKHRNGTLDPDSFMLTDFILGKTYRFRPILFPTEKMPTTNSLSKLDPIRLNSSGTMNWFVRSSGGGSSALQNSHTCPRVSQSPGHLSFSPEIHSFGRVRGLSAPGSFIHPQVSSRCSMKKDKRTTTVEKESDNCATLKCLSTNEHVDLWLKCIHGVIEHIQNSYLHRK